LSGDLGGDGVTGNNSCHVIFIDDASSVILKGLHIKSGYANVQQTTTLSSGTEQYNLYHFKGGGLYLAKAINVMVSQCAFYNNTAELNGGAIYVDYASSLNFENSLVSGNIADNGGGLFAGGISTVYGKHCTISSNTNQVSGGGGAAYTSLGSSNYFQNCIIWGNWTGFGGSGSLYQQYCLTQQLAGTTVNSLNKDPLFVNINDRDGNDNLLFTSDDGLKPSFSSDAINRGNNAYSTGITLDITGSPRIYNVQVDIGAYEYQFIPSVTSTTIFTDTVSSSTYVYGGITPVFSYTDIYNDYSICTVEPLGANGYTERINVEGTITPVNTTSVNSIPVVNRFVDIRPVVGAYPNNVSYKITLHFRNSDFINYNNRADINGDLLPVNNSGDKSKLRILHFTDGDQDNGILSVINPDDVDISYNSFTTFIWSVTFIVNKLGKFYVTSSNAGIDDQCLAFRGQPFNDPNLNYYLNIDCYRAKLVVNAGTLNGTGTATLDRMDLLGGNLAGTGQIITDSLYIKHSPLIDKKIFITGKADVASSTKARFNSLGHMTFAQGSNTTIHADSVVEFKENINFNTSVVVTFKGTVNLDGDGKMVFYHGKTFKLDTTGTFNVYSKLEFESETGDTIRQYGLMNVFSDTLRHNGGGVHIFQTLISGTRYLVQSGSGTVQFNANPNVGYWEYIHIISGNVVIKDDISGQSIVMDGGNFYSDASLEYAELRLYDGAWYPKSASFLDVLYAKNGVIEGLTTITIAYSFEIDGSLCTFNYVTLNCIGNIYHRKGSLVGPGKLIVNASYIVRTSSNGYKNSLNVELLPNSILQLETNTAISFDGVQKWEGTIHFLNCEDLTIKGTSVFKGTKMLTDVNSVLHLQQDTATITEKIYIHEYIRINLINNTRLTDNVGTTFSDFSMNVATYRNLAESRVNNMFTATASSITGNGTKLILLC
jgi:predicted outer membrane repeat protein